MRQLLPPTEWLPIRITQDSALVTESPTTTELAALIARLGTKGPEQLTLTRRPPVAGEYFTVRRESPDRPFRVTYCYGGEEDHWFADTAEGQRAYQLALGWARAEADWSVGENWALALLASVGQPPMTVQLNPDTAALRHLGVLPDGRQFLVTEPGPVEVNGSVCRFVARYVFDAEGLLLTATIVQSSAGASADADAQALVAELGPARREPIRIMPFTVTHCGIDFGLESRPTDGEDWIVVALPGDYLQFGPPWDGEYRPAAQE